MTVTLDQALHSRSDAIIFLRSGNVSPEDKAAVCSQWGAQWVINAINQSSDDENNYIINDDIYNNAYNAGQDKAADVSKDAAGKKAGDAAKTGTIGTASVVNAAGAVVSVAGGQVLKAAAAQAAGKAAGKIAGTIAGQVAGKIGGEVGAKAGTELIKEAGSKIGGKMAGEIAGKASGKIIADGTTTITKDVAEEAVKKAGEEVAGNSVKEIGKQIGFMITCTLGAATAAIYWATRPNKEAKEGIDELQNTMTESQGALNAEQANMEQATNDIAEKSAEAEDVQEDAQSDIDDKKTAYDRFYESFMELKAKVDAGEPLTEDEKALFGALIQYLKECGVNIEDLVKASSDEVKDILNEIGLSEESFNQAMETIGEVQGATDYASSTDIATRIMCYVQAGAQGLNAASSAYGMYEAIATATSGSWCFGATAWAWVFVGLGAAGMAGSGAAVAEQLKWASEISTEINMRLETEDVNTETNDLWEQSVAAYDEYFSYVEGLNVVEPDDVDPNVVDGINPDEVPTVDPNDPGLVGGNPVTTPEPKNKDEDDKKKFLFINPNGESVA